MSIPKYQLHFVKWKIGLKQARAATNPLRFRLQGVQPILALFDQCHRCEVRAVGGKHAVDLFHKFNGWKRDLRGLEYRLPTSPRTLMFNHENY